MRISDWSSDVCSSDLGLQVVERCDLAGRVAGHRQRQFPGRDAAAVIADADQADAAFLQVDVDPVRAGVERVLDQFLDRRSRPLDDFAGSDLVDEGVGTLLDAHQGNDTDRRRVPWRLTGKSALARQGLPTAADPACAAARAAYSVPGGGWRRK